MRDDERPRDPDPDISPDIPTPPGRDLDRITEEVPEPPGKDEVRPGDDVNPDAGTIEPPD